MILFFGFDFLIVVSCFYLKPVLLFTFCRSSYLTAFGAFGAVF